MTSNQYLVLAKWNMKLITQLSNLALLQVTVSSC